MKIKQTILLIITLIGFNVALLIPVASAANCGGVTTSIISCDEVGQCPDGENAFEGSSTDAKYKDIYGHEYGKCIDGSTPNTDVKENGIWSLLTLAINILTAGVVVAALGGVVYGSIMYTTAGGSADQVKKARTIITNVVIGLVTYALMFSFLNFLIPGGLF